MHELQAAMVSEPAAAVHSETVQMSHDSDNLPGVTPEPDNDRGSSSLAFPLID